MGELVRIGRSGVGRGRPLFPYRILNNGQRPPEGKRSAVQAGQADPRPTSPGVRVDSNLGGGRARDSRDRSDISRPASDKAREQARKPTSNKSDVDKRVGNALDRLEANGVLAQMDKNGVSIAHHLRKLDRAIDAQNRGENVRIPEKFRPPGGRGDTKELALTEVRKHLLFDLARPRRIRQGQDTLDCAAAVAQSTLARQDPGEYVRMTMELATAGSTKTRMGHKVSLDGAVGDSRVRGRTLTGDLFQPGLKRMAQKHWPDADGPAGSTSLGGRQYSSTMRYGNRGFGTTVRRLGGDVGAGEALTSYQYGQLVDSLLAGNQASVNIRTGDQRRRLPSVVREALDSGSVQVGLRTDGGQLGHAVEVLRMDATYDQGTGKGGVTVVYQDPQTGESHMPAGQFFDKVAHVTLPVGLRLRLVDKAPET